MAIEYTWTIATCEHDIVTGGITVAHWRVSAVDGDHIASLYGTCDFAPDTTDPDFKPYDEITENNVLAWVYASVGKEATEAALKAKVEADKNPVSGVGTPWARIHYT